MIEMRTIFICFLLAFSTSTYAESRQISLVINAHGAKTSRTFTLPPSLSVFAPGDLSQAYSYRDDGNDPKGIENIFASSRLPAYNHTSTKLVWHRYTIDENAKIPEVVLTPLNFDKDLSEGESAVTRELKYLKENIENRPQHWAFDTGAASILFIRRLDGVERIVGHRAVKKFLDGYNVPQAGFTEEDAPIILLVPKENKVKVLAQTSLSEVVKLVELAFAETSGLNVKILLATCNEEGLPSENEVVLSTVASRSIAISTLFPK